MYFFNSKTHLQKAFCAKIQINHRSKSGFFQNMSIGHQKNRLSKPYLTGNLALQNNEEINQVGAEKLGNTTNFVISIIFPLLCSWIACFEYFYKPFAALN